ncbi:hypothetical protein HN51_011558 [Arachis hypogaea]
MQRWWATQRGREAEVDMAKGKRRKLGKRDGRWAQGRGREANIEEEEKVADLDEGGADTVDLDKWWRVRRGGRREEDTMAVVVDGTVRREEQ